MNENVKKVAIVIDLPKIESDSHIVWYATSEANNEIYGHVRNTSNIFGVFEKEHTPDNNHKTIGQGATSTHGAGYQLRVLYFGDSLAKEVKAEDVKDSEGNVLGIVYHILLQENGHNQPKDVFNVDIMAFPKK